MRSNTFSRASGFAIPAASGGSAAQGLDVLAPVEFCPFSPTVTYTGLAHDALLNPVRVVAPMKLRALAMSINASGAGTHEWGLFDASVNAAAAVKVAGGSGAIAGTSWQQIAAAGAPVDLEPGSYILVFKWPGTGMATLNYSTSTMTGGKLARYKAGYTWSNTPDLTSGWTVIQNVFILALVGDLDGAGNQW